MVEKATSLARGAAAVAAGAVFGVFAVIFVLLTHRLGAERHLRQRGRRRLARLPGRAVILLLLLTVGAFLFAWRKLKVGPPTPKMAIDEARKIRETVSASAASPTEPTRCAERRSAEEIRASIEQNRQELGTSLVRLRDEVSELTDWRAQVRRNSETPARSPRQSAGFVLAGGIGGAWRMLFGRRKKRR